MNWGWINAIGDTEFFLTLLGLILADVVLGIAAALRSGEFDLRALGQFYKTNIVPYVLGYLVLNSVVKIIIVPAAASLMPFFQTLISGGITAVMLVTLYGSLIGSICRHLGVLGVNIPKIQISRG